MTESYKFLLVDGKKGRIRTCVNLLYTKCARTKLLTGIQLLHPVFYLLAVVCLATALVVDYSTQCDDITHCLAHCTQCITESGAQ